MHKSACILRQRGQHRDVPPSQLRSLLASRGGAMPWRDWMEAALYDPDHGYYTANIRTVGRSGDFSTSATMGDSLALAIRRWIRDEWRLAGERLALIEIGPGDGSLHRKILSGFGWLERWRTHSILVDCSPVLRCRQQESLRGFRGVQWHDSVAEALDACGGEAIIFSNELADAFPATLLQRDAGAWKEVWLEINGPDTGRPGAIVETLRPCPPGLTSSAFSIPWDEGQRIEVLDAWRQWLATWLPHWKRGSMLTIDYGGRPADIYFRRPGGTARGFLHHQRISAGDLYGLTGRCDVTVDVNFSDLQDWGEAAGLTTAACVSQREFVWSCGSGGDGEADFRELEAAEAFQCLIQRRDANAGCRPAAAP